MITTQSILAQKIKHFRDVYNLNQTEFGMNCGVSEDTIGFIEREQANPCLDTLCAIAAYMDITVSELLSADE